MSILLASRPNVEPTSGLEGLLLLQPVPQGGVTNDSPQRAKSMPMPALSLSAAAPPLAFAQGMSLLPT